MDSRTERLRAIAQASANTEAAKLRSIAANQSDPRVIARLKNMAERVERLDWTGLGLSN